MSAYIVSRECVNGILHHTLQIIARRRSPIYWWNPALNGLTSMSTPTDKAGEKRVTSLGQMLFDENIRSIKHRYGEDAFEEEIAELKENPFEFKMLLQDGVHVIGQNMALAPVDLDPKKLWEYLTEYEYQSCESRDWEVTEACFFIRRVAWELAGIVIR